MVLLIQKINDLVQFSLKSDGAKSNESIDKKN